MSATSEDLSVTPVDLKFDSSAGRRIIQRRALMLG